MFNKKNYLIAAGVISFTALGTFLVLKPVHNNTGSTLLSNILAVKTYSLNELVKGLDWNNDGYEIMVNQTMTDELTFQQVQKSLLNPLEKQFTKTGEKDFQSFFTKEGVQIFGININPSTVVDEHDGIKRLSWNETTPTITKEINLNNYAAKFSHVEDFRLDIKNFNISMDDRRDSDATTSKMVLEGFMDLRGQTTEGTRRQDVGPVKLVVKLVDGEWKIQEMAFKNVVTTTSSRAPAFKSETATAFNEGAPSVYLRREAIRRGGYALSLTDINQDGVLDMYVGTQQESEIWMFDKTKNKYVRSMQEALKGEKMVKTAIFTDLDNDKFEDLFLTTFNPIYQGDGQNEDLVLYKNSKNTLTKVVDPAKGMRKISTYYPMPAVAGDFNGDGLTDIYVGFPGKKDFTFTNLSGHEIDGDIAVQGLFMNRGSMTFNGNEAHFPTIKEGNRQHLFPHAALAVDWNKDHNIDIVVIDDQENLSPFYLNKGNAKFEQVAERIGIRDTLNAMSIAAGDFNNDGLMDFVMTSISLDAGQRSENAMINHWHKVKDKFRTGVSGNGIRLFQQAKNGNFDEVTNMAGLNYPGQGAAGVEFVDYNNDGKLDIYLANGLWSGNDRNQEVGHYFINMIRKELGANEADLKDRADKSAASPFMNLLIDFRGDIFNSNLSGDKTLSLGGYQRNRLYRNNGDGTFTDVAFMEGVDSISDGYVVALGDLDRDGKMDMVLRNGDPAQKDYTFPAVEVLHNNGPWEGKSIDLALKNNRGVDAIGVGATIEYEGTTQYRQLISNNGAAQSERVLHFGIGKRDTVPKLTIHWASGDKVYTNLKAGRHEFSEISSILSQQ
ncbi:CRTAC1 family protein [Bacteriovorax sp. PP10]|uniref:CRTAC1 family protein n=1 Tax=Bacteriovorax antarcticus TaxID=3088717 RepID=A0ABU5VTN3_9BACT|nr:CRTAC1 family protein [Bacteriovorax sp. PP10]MEA9356409.1 CRTAC1 family protein [Bacteriovorax sp. PP10]